MGFLLFAAIVAFVVIYAQLAEQRARDPRNASRMREKRDRAYAQSMARESAAASRRAKGA